MSFIDILNDYPADEVNRKIYSATEKDVERALNAEKLDIWGLAALLSPTAKKYLPQMGAKAREITLRRFGKTIKLYAPIYVSNACVNSCLYCGFNRKTGIERITLTDEEIRREAEILAATGIKNVILVSGDNRAAFSDERLESAVKICTEYFPLVSIEVRALETDGYEKLKNAGADGFTMFQETYIKDIYEKLHPAGPKADFLYRLSCPERAAEAGLRSIGIGALLGLTDFRLDAFYMMLHANYLADKYWRSHISASFPRIRSSAGQFDVKKAVTDGELFQATFAFRLFLHDAGINISTREAPALRDKLMMFGATLMSAGSKTEPGGYAKAKEDAGQFHVEDTRSVAEFTEALRTAGYDPVGKDWDAVMREAR